MTPGHSAAARRGHAVAPLWLRLSLALGVGPLQALPGLTAPPAIEPPLQAPDAAAHAVPACPRAESVEKLPTADPLLRPPVSSPNGGSDPSDYRRQLSTTALGWPLLNHWCVWIEPSSGSSAAQIWEHRWRAAVLRALAQWQLHLPITLVDDPEAAQVRLWRQRPALSQGAGGQRASHGRATLSLQRVQRAGNTRLEPSLEVQISPGQREVAIEATALHELGHAFGLWGHSDRAEDALAAVPTAVPVLQLSPRDRATLIWLYAQPGRLGHP